MGFALNDLYSSIDLAALLALRKVLLHSSWMVIIKFILYLDDDYYKIR